MMGLTGEEFNTIALQHTFPPHRTDFKEIEIGPLSKAVT
jgi:hypothetical protein